ncbi:hypothetical protein ACSQ67_025252 [Phaseolus vulgaris]
MDGPQIELINNVVWEKEGARGDFAPTLNLSHILGDDGAIMGSICNTPPRHQRYRGLWELVKSNIQPRWNAKSGMGTPQVGSNSMSRLGMNSVAIFNGDIVNGNSKFWKSENNVEPIKLWR